MMPYYDKAVIDQVKKIDLLSYLRTYEPDNIIDLGRDNYCTREHDSLKISNGLWFWFSKGFGGASALDYLQKVKCLSFVDAVTLLLSKPIELTKIIKKRIKEDELKFTLPKKNKNNNIAISYLLKRGINKNLILECISKNYLYEDIYHNVVFIGYNHKDEPKYAFIRGTNDNRYMKEAYGSSKAFSFKLNAEEKSNRLHLFESAIDLLSYASINKEYYKENLLSLSGVYQSQHNIEESKLPIALNIYLNLHPEVNEIYLHLDNDFVGRFSTNSLEFLLKKHYKVYDSPSPIGKDYNDYLMSLINKKEKNYVR